MMIVSERLKLVELQLGDAEFILRLLNEPTFINNIADKGVRTVEDAVAHLKDGPICSYKNHGFGLWKVLLKEMDIPVGICGLIKREALEDVDLGYALNPSYVGQGYAYEAALAVLKHAKDNLQLKRIVAIVKLGNKRSIALLNKLGFEYEKMVSLSETDQVMLYVALL